MPFYCKKFPNILWEENLKFIEEIKNYLNKEFVNEDEEEVAIKLYPPSTLYEIRKFEQKNKLELPKELLELYLFSNGIDLFDTKILPIQDLEYFDNAKLFIFHQWGDGNFDAISADNKVFFIYHSLENKFLVVDSFRDWCLLVIKEFSETGILLHPEDYFYRNGNGLYKEVFRKMSLMGGDHEKFS